MLDFKSTMLLLFFVWLISISLIKTLFFTKTQSSLKLPHGPPLALPLIGHLYLFRSLIIHQALSNLSTKYGPLFKVKLGSKLFIVASTPEMAKQILKTNEEFCPNRPGLIVTEYLTYGASDYIFIPYGPYWRFMKKICMNELLSGRTIQQFVWIREEEIEAFLRLILQHTFTGKPLQIRKELMRLTNNVISRMTMGKCAGTNDGVGGGMSKVAQEVGALIGTFNLGDYVGFLRKLGVQAIGRKVKEVHEKLDTMLEEVMGEHEEARKMMKIMGDHKGERRKDLVEILLDLMEAENSEMKLTRESAKAFVLEMFVAGTNSSASLVEWALAELIRNPKIFSKAREEIDSVVGKNRVVKESDIPNLPYLQAIVKETLRLHPPGPLIPRETTRSFKIGEYDVPSSSTLVVNVWAIGRDPNYWDNPLEYWPERFLAKDENLDVRGQNYKFLPFGSGRRGCPGASFALLVVQITLASMIQCFDWNVVNFGEKKDNEIDMAEDDGVTLFLAKPLLCRPVPHFVPFS
ncbi:beta-amyrin 24-hydroxylase [Senna tora]|uniref:Beta-amyrin 24-hydroxylase n=1 Tax=Senna tora TaxID=362788 RepID=A0A835C9Y1_9FABA|nr:beta-amyrin 24-hydroxylase [Senna tora]